MDYSARMPTNADDAEVETSQASLDNDEDSSGGSSAVSAAAFTAATNRNTQQSAIIEQVLGVGDTAAPPPPTAYNHHQDKDDNSSSAKAVASAPLSGAGGAARPVAGDEKASWRFSSTSSNNDQNHHQQQQHQKQKHLVETCIPEGFELQRAKKTESMDQKATSVVGDTKTSYQKQISSKMPDATQKNKGGSVHVESRSSREFDVMDVVHLRASLANDNNNNAESDNDNGATTTIEKQQTQLPYDNNSSNVVAPDNHPPLQPGAFSGAPGQPLHRRDNLCYKVVGVVQVADHRTTTTGSLLSNDNLATAEEDAGVMDQTNDGVPITTHCLAEATPVDDNAVTPDMEAQPFDTDSSDRKRAAEARKRRIFLAGSALLLLLAIATIVAVTVTVSTTANNNSYNDASLAALLHPTMSPTRYLPPMENLESLYDSLPQKTKESLYNMESSQHKAWEWLLHHPNIRTLEEWRKEQLFAMATLFYSFQGPSWSESTPGRGRWMNYELHECSWNLRDEEIVFLEQQNKLIIGPDAYSHKDYQPCSEDGNLQYLVLRGLDLVAINLQPSMPPEVQLLTSLKILGITTCRLNTKLSDFFVPEFINLPSLEALNFYKSGVTGTIPHELFGMTNLRHLSIGSNKLSGVIPSEISRMSSLEYFNVHSAEGIGGKLTSELGLMTALTGLDVSWSTFSGTIPTELGSLTHMKKLTLDRNWLSGNIPSQLGLLTANTWLALYENSLSGSIPTELGLATDTVRLRIWNNALTGSVPRELGRMTNLIDFRIGNDMELDGPYNNFLGSLPIELWDLSNLQWLHLPNLPNLHGRIPPEMTMPNLTLFSISGSPHLSGTIPESICPVEDLDFDCSDVLCGCECECIVA